MTPQIKNNLTDIARREIPIEDPSHDIQHTLRVLANAIHIAEAEQADLDIIIPAALFHDIITYPKMTLDHRRRSKKVLRKPSRF